MNKKGFTLVELLAVIVILAVIALITVPQVLRLIEDAQRDALKDSAYGIIEAGNLFYAKNSLSLFEEKQERVDFEIISNRFANVKNTDQKLDFKGKMPKSGKFQINNNGGTAISICNGKYCACKGLANTRVTVQTDDCNIDSSTGEIESNVPEGKLKELEEKITNLEKKQVKVGTVISYMASSTPPEGYLACDGKTYNISDYPKLAEAIKNGLGSYNYYGGDGTKTFAVPDLRGEFLRGTGVNNHESRYGEKEGNGAEVGKHQGATINVAGAAGINVMFTLKPEDSFDRIPRTLDKVLSQTNTLWFGQNVKAVKSNDIYTMEYTSRPTNTSVLYCIKYE